jgi:hypothetical protein
MTLLDPNTDLLDYAIREEFRRIMNDVGPSGLPEFLHVGNDVYVARPLHEGPVRQGHPSVARRCGPEDPRGARPRERGRREVLQDE